MLRIFPLVAGLLISFSCAAAPYFNFSKKAREVYRQAISLRMKAATTSLDDLRKAEPENYLSHYLENYIDVLGILAADDKAAYAVFQKKILPRVDKVAQGDRRSPYYLFCQAEMRLQSALLEARFGNYISSLTEAKKAYALLEENERRYPDFIANKKSLGLLHTMMGSIPDEYRWAVEVLSGMKGTVEQGRHEMEAVVAYGQTNPDFILADEALATYAVLLLYAGNQKDKAWQAVRSGELDHKSNPLAAYVLAVVAGRTGHNDEAIRYLQEAPETADFQPFPYRRFLLGVCKLYRLDSDANKPLEMFLQQCQGEMSINEALQKLGWHYLLQGNADVYTQYMQRLKLREAGRSDTDKAAFREAQSGERPDPLLLKSRLLFDGGYYKRSLEVLQGASGRYESNRKQKLEYQYRLARIHHELKNYPEAVRLYTKTIQEGAADPWYFACNAALQLGILQETNNQPELARAAFRQCLEIHPKEYADSLHARAKAGLNRLK